MTKLRNPLMSLRASGSLSRAVTFVNRRLTKIVEKKPEVPDAKTEPQLAWRTMFNLCVDLWHDLSAAEKAVWESQGTARHMTGYAWYISQCLRPNPGIYLPLAGGIMTGTIFMSEGHVHGLPNPIHFSDAARKGYVDASSTPGREGARVYNNANLAIPHNTWTVLTFNSERYDTNVIHDNAINNSRLTCKTAGKYLIIGHAQFAENATANRYFKIREGGDTDIVAFTINAQTGALTSCVLSTIYNLSLNEYVEFMVFQNCTAPLNILYSAQVTPEFMMQRIG